MKNQFNRFALRFLAGVLLGLVLLCFHGSGGVGAVFAPRFASPWELSKLAFWPMLGSLLLTGVFSEGIPATLRRALPCLLLTPLALFAALWAVSGLESSAAISLTLWVVALCVGLAMADQGKQRNVTVWLVLVVALGIAYGLLSFLPPAFGPFLDPTDVAAMATIPY